MPFSIIKVYRDEFREGYLGVRTWLITFFGIPIFRARLTSTNNQAVRTLTVVEEKKTKVIGFNSNNDEVKSIDKKNKSRSRSSSNKK